MVDVPLLRHADNSFRNVWGIQECFLPTQAAERDKDFQSPLRSMWPHIAEKTDVLSSVGICVAPCPCSISKPHYFWFLLFSAPFFTLIRFASFLSLLPLAASPTLSSYTKCLSLLAIASQNVSFFTEANQSVIIKMSVCHCACLCCSPSTCSKHWICVEWVSTFA